MLHELLTLTRPLFVLDTETTGSDPENDRVVEIGIQRWEATGMTKEWASYVNPGIPISPAATAVHHITDEMVKDAYTFRQLAANMAKGFINCDYAGQQVRFDLRIFSAEMARAGQPWDYNGARIVDSLRLEALAIPRDLSTLYEKYAGKKHDGAHGVLADVKASLAVIVGQLKAYSMLPRDLDQLHAAQWPGFIDAEGRFRIVDGIAKVMFGKWKGKPMRRVERDYWQWISGPKSTFSPEIKQIARAALLNKFPD